MMSKQLTLRMEDDLPLREVVYRTLRQGILDGTLQGGERLKEIDLAGTLGVSRTPVREAIRKLEKEGLVRILPRRGALVAPNASGDEQDVWEVELALRELALVRACRCGAFFPGGTRQDTRQNSSRNPSKGPRQDAVQDALHSSFGEAQGNVRKALEAGDADACARFEEAFFDDICRAGGNETLRRLLGEVSALSRPARARRIQTCIQNKNSLPGHIRCFEDLVEALGEGDEKKAAVVLAKMWR